MKSIFISLIVVILFLISVPAQAVVQYTITDLGVLGGAWSIGQGINNSGQVVGFASYSYDSTNHAFRTAANKPINPATDKLGTLGGTEGTYSSAYRINDSGQAVGYAYINGDTNYHAFRTAANQPINPATDDLGTLAGASSVAEDINNSGQVVGNSGGHAFRTGPNLPINPATDDLGDLGGGAYAHSTAYGINNSGQVVGNSLNKKGYVHAYRTAANQAINPDTDDLGTLGGVGSWAYGINDLGQVVGIAYNKNGDQHAFRTAPNQPINPDTDDLGTLGGRESEAWSINNSGQVVGDADTISGHMHAFVYVGDGPMQDLNDLIPPNLGWDLTQAADINDLGQIVGYGGIGSQTHAFLLTPIPEPSTLALLAIAFIGLLALRRRRAA